jgi:uncharacterized repeat protein (TIGR01451 family)
VLAKTAIAVLALLILGQSSATALVPGPAADVSVTVSAYPPAVPPGARLDIVIGVDNAGPFDAMNVAVRIAVPAKTTFVSWANASYSREDVPATTPPPGGTGTVNACIGRLPPPPPYPDGHPSGRAFVLTVLVDGNLAQGETITATATAGGVRTADALWCPATTVDPAPDNNTSSSTVTISGPADIAVAGSAVPDPVGAGGAVTYSLAITNAGPYNAENVTFSDWYDVSTTLVSFTQDSGPTFSVDTHDPTGTNKISGSRASLASGATARFTLVVQAPSTVPSWGGWVNNLLYAETATGEADRDNNRVNVRSQVLPSP